MNRLVLILIVMLGVNAMAQEAAKKALLTIEEHAYFKKFNKKWKKTKEVDWEKSVQEAESIEELNKLFNEYSDLFAQTSSFSMGNSTATNEIEFIEYMIKVEGVLANDFAPDWSEEDRMKWRGELEEFMVLEKENKKKKDQMARFQKMTAMVADFSKKFPKIWEDSKESAFENTSSIAIVGGSEIAVTKDQYGVASLSVFFDTEDDAKMAEKLMEELVLIIEENVEKGYKQGNDMDAEYTGSMRKKYQFEGEKFAETAKKPTVAIGVLKNKKGVKVVVTEPVFGH
ncbi:hypothetical protein [Parvicella tangerina]|uniref:Uncharacterized protein n=1 Tax=Parvicella tangerina TaxID=2829795 RepID=A0A916JLY0_9FLAO|nr:hypothetical protein [Parvicella tangerina]CAG5080541.1 hypothetical protein CRYO30217_01365 [Parvicella tangerina]